MQYLPMTTYLADELFPCQVIGEGSGQDVDAQAAVMLTEHFGLPRAEMDFDIVDYTFITPEGRIFVGYVWCEGVKYTIVC
jgi:hypothetical protein